MPTGGCMDYRLDARVMYGRAGMAASGTRARSHDKGKGLKKYNEGR